MTWLTTAWSARADGRPRSGWTIRGQPRPGQSGGGLTHPVQGAPVCLRALMGDRMIDQVIDIGRGQINRDRAGVDLRYLEEALDELLQAERLALQRAQIFLALVGVAAPPQ